MMVSTGIIEAGADAVADMPSTMLISFLSIISLLVTLMFWTYVLFAYLSLNVSGRRPDSFL